MINLVIKQRIILAHIDGMSNRAIANVLHLSKDTVNKYVNEYNVIITLRRSHLSGVARATIPDKQSHLVTNYCTMF